MLIKGVNGNVQGESEKVGKNNRGHRCKRGGQRREIRRGCKEQGSVVSPKAGRGNAKTKGEAGNQSKMRMLK